MKKNLNKYGYYPRGFDKEVPIYAETINNLPDEILNKFQEYEELGRIKGRITPTNDYLIFYKSGDKEMEDFLMPYHVNANKSYKNINANESWKNPNPSAKELEFAKEEAKKISREEGVVQHVNEIRPGIFSSEDWYDEDITVTSFENGIEL